MDWPPRFSTRLQIALLVAIVTFGAWLRLRSAGDSLWLDELHTAWVAQAADWNSLQHRAAMGNQSPLYYCGVAAAVRLLGPSEFAVRLLSLLAGSLLPVACWGLARRLFRWDGQPERLPYGLLAAWFVAVDPLAVFYSQEARPYACVQLAAVLHVWLLVELLDRSTWLKRIGWIACGGLLFYLHYTAALVIAAEVVFVIGWFIAGARQSGQPDRRSLTQWVGNLLSLILLVLPTLIQLREIYERRQNWALFVDRVGLAELAELPKMIPWSPAALLLAIAAVIALVLRHPLSLRERARMREARLSKKPPTHSAASHPDQPINFAWAVVPSIWLLLCWLVLPIAIVAVTSSTDWLRLWHMRYLIGVTPAAFLLTAMLPRILPPLIGVLLALGLALYAAWTSNASLDWLSRHGHPLRTEDWKAAGAFLNDQTDHYPILLRSGLIEADALRTSSDERLTDYCRFPLTSLYQLDRTASDIHPLTMTKSGQLTEPLRETLQPRSGESRTYWLVARGDAARADQIVRELQQTYAPHATHVNAANHHSFGRVQVRMLKLTTSPQVPDSRPNGQVPN